MKCPNCCGKVKKGGVSRYWCPKCRAWWLIQKLSTYPPMNEVNILDKKGMEVNGI